MNTDTTYICAYFYVFCVDRTQFGKEKLGCNEENLISHKAERETTLGRTAQPQVVNEISMQ